MKKRLLFAFAMFMTAASGFAQAVGDYVYTPKGKFKITADKTSGIVNADLTGWTAVTADEAGAEVADQFTFTEAGMSAQKNEATEGMTYALTGIDASTSYIVTFTIAQPEPGMTMHRGIQPWLCDHIKGDSNVNCLNISGVNMDDETDVVEYAAPTEIFPGEAKNYSFAITPDENGTARTYSITLKGWASDLIISDIKVQEADPVGDERTVALLLDHAKKLVDLRAWDASDELDALNENIEFAEGLVADQNTQVEDMEGAVEGLKEAIADFEKNQMDDYLPAAADKIPFEAPSKVQKVNNIGVWTGWGGGGGRIHANQGGIYDVGHYAGNTVWGYGDGCIGLTARMYLDEGDYIYSMQNRAMMRLKSTSSCWDVDNAVKALTGILYVRPCTDGDDAEFSHRDCEAEKSMAVAYKQYDMSCSDLEMHTIAFHITSAGTYEFGIKTYAQDFAVDQKNGGTLEVADARIYAKTNAEFSKAQYDYEDDVRGQIQAGRDNLTKAAEYLTDAKMPWGHADLQEAINEVEPLIAGYEAWSQADIIGTMNAEVYDKSKGLEALNEDYDEYYRGMASEVYRTATKVIIAANNAFTAKNDTLASLGNSIAGAEETLKLRIYDMATGKAGLMAAIADAKTVNSQMKAAEYSEENAATIVATIETINAAIDDLKASIPASAITVLADINFDEEPTTDGFDPWDENGEATFTGAVNSMLVTSYSADGVNNSCQIGIEDNGETILEGVLRVGNSEGIVNIEVPADNFGTDVVRVTMDWWFGNLSGKNAGFYLRDAEDANVGGLYCNRYNGTTEYDPLGILGLGGVIGRGSSTQSNAVICEDGNLTHLEYIIDYGNKIAYSVSTLPTTVVTTPQTILENANPIAKFVLKSNYNNNDRRCWFDNLKIERIAADPSTVTDMSGIVDVKVPVANNGKIYSISGMEVKKAVKGIYIVNGKKFVVK